MVVLFMSILFASATICSAPVISSSQDEHTVKYAQLELEPEAVVADPRVVRGRQALAAAYPEGDISILVYIKYGLHNIDLFEVAADEFVVELGARPTYENPNLRLRIQTVDRKVITDGERETFAVSLHEGSQSIAASRSTVTCQGNNIAKIPNGTNREGPKGCLIDSATVSEMFARLANKI